MSHHDDGYAYLESQRLILADDAIRSDLSRLDCPPDTGSVSLLARTVSLGAYPTAAIAYYALTPLGLLGTETEGSSGVVASSGSNFFGFNVGSGVPPVGTQVLATFVGNRWVFSYGT